MHYELLSNESIVSTYSTNAAMKSRPVAMGENNYANLTAYIRSLVDLIGTPSRQLNITAEGSNDRVNWASIGAISISPSTTGVATAEGVVGFAWLRFDINLAVGGSSGDSAEAVFDLQVNLIRK